MSNINIDSLYRVYGIGYAVKDLPPGETVLEIFLQEHMAGHTGEFKADGGEDESVGGVSKTPLGSITKSTLKKGVTIKASWRAKGSNRITAPTVYQGEMVTVYRYGNSDRFYWTLEHFEHDLRRKEVVVYAFSNLDKEESFGEQFDAESSYYVKFDTINKIVHLHTSDNDKEKAAYDFMLNTKEGIFTIKDNKGNSIVLESPKGALTVTVPHIHYKCSTFKVDASSSVDINTPKLTTSGGTYTVKHAVRFMKPTDFKASVKMNHNATTTVGPHGHSHTII